MAEFIPYAAPKSDATSVAAAIKDLRKTVAVQGETTSGQINGTIQKIQDQISFLLGQTTISAPTTTSAQITANPAEKVDTTWADFDAAKDASLTFTTSSTGSILVTISGHVYSEVFATAGNMLVDTFIGLEILKDGERVVSPDMRTAISAQTETQGLGGSGGRLSYAFPLSLSADTTYVARTVRGWNHSMAGTSPAGWQNHVWKPGTTIQIMKVGM